MAPRTGTKTLTRTAAAVADEPAEESFPQRRRPDLSRFRLQVDRQTKGSYTTIEAANQAGLAIKTAYPVVQVGVYDTVEGVNTIIEIA
jgi:hypothetical protein